MHQTIVSSPQSYLLKFYLSIVSPKHSANHIGETVSSLSAQLSAYR